MVKCCAPKCSNASYRKTPDITFHRFPKDTLQREMWKKNINRQNWEPNSTSVICSQHFVARFLINRDIRTMLSPGAVPTIFIKDLSSEDNKDSSLAPKEVQSNIKRSAAGGLVLNTIPVPAAPKKETKIATNDTPIVHSFITTASTSTNSTVTDPHIINRHKTAQVLCNRHKSAQKSIQCQYSKIFQKFKKKLMAKDKMLKAMRERNKRLKKKVQHFIGVIKELRGKLNEED